MSFDFQFSASESAALRIEALVNPPWLPMIFKLYRKKEGVQVGGKILEYLFTLKLVTLTQHTRDF
jgi:hypothetical protein